ncbi:MAG TPA: hypothetical protein VK776_06325 [Bryobacteraceae bacterium]|nr:hypothetical protein [Bryobacteraceae bacterium]
MSRFLELFPENWGKVRSRWVKSPDQGSLLKRWFFYRPAAALLAGGIEHTDSTKVALGGYIHLTSLRLEDM